LSRTSAKESTENKTPVLVKQVTVSNECAQDLRFY